MVVRRINIRVLCPENRGFKQTAHNNHVLHHLGQFNQKKNHEYHGFFPMKRYIYFLCFDIAEVSFENSILDSSVIWNLTVFGLFYVSTL